MTISKTSFPFKIMSALTAVVFAVTLGVWTPHLQAAPGAPFTFSLPSPQEIIGTSAVYEPVMVKGMKINSDQALSFSFVLDTGNTQLTKDQLDAESQKIIKYFLVSLTTPEDDLWVNLSPFEKDRITSEKLYQTQMGRDLLGQDYILKKMTASLLFPDTESGKKFWEKIHLAMYEKFADTDVPVDVFHKIWIVPESAEIFVQGDTVLITSSKLKVMLEEDYFSLKQSQRLKGQTSAQEDENSLFRDEAMKKILKDVVVPMIEEEVNRGQYFANLRQIYHALLLAKWFKANFRQELLEKIKTAQKPQEAPKDQPKQQDQQQQQQQQQQQKEEEKKADEPNIEEIYQKYLDAFKAGSEGYIRQAYDPVQKDIVVKKYVTGGVLFNRAMMTPVAEPLLKLVGDGVVAQFFLERILPVVDQDSSTGLAVATAVLGLNVLLGFFNKNVGGIDLKTDAMKINMTGSGFDASKLKNQVIVDPTKIGTLVPVDIKSKPLPSIDMFLNPVATKSN